MPSVGTRPVISSRRSSRVFVPKSTSDLSPVSTARLHSPKKDLLVEWNRNRTVADGWGHASVGEFAHSEERDDNKVVDIVYRRKRPRSSNKAERESSSSPNSDSSKRFGIVFTRKKRNKKPKLVTCLDQIKTSENGSREGRRIAARLVLVGLVEKRENSARIFMGFLLSVLRWIRRNCRARIGRLISLVMNGPISRVFSMHGVQFLSAQEGKHGVLVAGGEYVPPHLGLCMLYNANESIPILHLNFSSLPFYFTSLHLSISLSSLYIPSCLINPPSSVLTPDTDDDDSDETDTDTDTNTKPSSPIIQKHPLKIKIRSIKPLKDISDKKKPLTPHPQTSGTLRISSSMKIRQTQQKKMTRSNSSRNYNPSSNPYFSLNSHRPKPLELPPDDSSQSGLDSDVSTPTLGRNKRSGASSSLKSPVMRVHERLALAEAKQNIDSVRCKANILVTLEDRCYREDDVMLSIELSSESDDWLICVTLQDGSKFRHKPSAEMKACVVNRYTHAYMWTVDDVMRLEFEERLDWLLFKELHGECRVRNSSQVKKVKEVGPVHIPIPGVSEVAEGYENELFVLPESYIRVSGDEVERAMKKEWAIYDADSGDERWMDAFNNEESECGRVRVSLKEFEELVSLFEKDAYVNGKECMGDEIDGVLERCKELEKGDADVVAAVYDYWLNKRATKGGTPLIRIFQGGGRMRKLEWCSKPYLKKKRSFKRQRSQVTTPRLLNSQPPTFFRDWAQEEAIRRVQESQAAARRAQHLAIETRTRAQTLMERADLATYRAYTALRIAEAKSRLSAHPNLLHFDPFPIL